jgi:dephospho-CoA kinase
MSILVGLTGSIGSGKTLAANYFNTLGAYILYSDLISRQLVAPEEPAWQEIVEEFGEDYINPDKTLNRSKLADIIFKNDQKRIALEGILHHRVISVEKELYSDYKKKDDKAIVIIDSPLLIESQNYKNVDKVIIIQCNTKLQIQRVMSRDGDTTLSVKNRLKSQMLLEEKLNYADYVLYNTGTQDQLKAQIDLLYLELKDLA